MGIDSPVYRAVEKVVELFDLQPDVTVYSYKEEEHFNSLWSLIQNKEAFSKLSTIIIAWEGIPSRKNTDLVNTSKYLTPIDWAVALSLAINDSVRDAHHPYPDLKILVLDIGQSSTESDSIKFIDQFPKRDIKHLPWIRMFTPESDGDLWNLDAFFFSLIVVDNKDARIPSMREAFEKEKRDLDVIKNIWASFLTRPSTPGDHHALANIIGPLLLMTDSDKDIQVTALRLLMQAVDLIQTNVDQDSMLTRGGKPWIDWSRLDLENIQKDEDTKLELILIDDQYEQGWGEIVCLATGADYKPETKPSFGLHTLTPSSGKVVVKACVTADWLFGEPGKQPIIDGRQKRFTLILDESNTSKHPEVLFLDLRLFSGKDIKKESAFFQKILPLAKMLNSEKNLPWPGISDREIELVEEWITNPKREDYRYITALTFLPRILSLTDLSLPIVVFSSTGRRDLTEKLKRYGNIITIFEKPRYTVDMPNDISKQVKNKFQDAIQNAIFLLNGRFICKKTININEAALSKLTEEPLFPNESSIPAFSHMEIYLDESGTSGHDPFSIGGLIVAYPDYSVVSKLQQELVDKGIYWNTLHGTNPLAKRMNDLDTKKVFDEFFDSCKRMQLFIAGIRMTEPLVDYYDNPNKRHFPVKDTESDSIYIRTLTNLLEVAIFELIPKWTKNKTTLSIFPGTRTISVNLKDSLGSEETATDYYGFGQHGSGRYYVISPNSFVTVVANLLNSRPDVSDKITVHHSRGVVYAYESHPQTWKNIRVQGYFADILLNKWDAYKDYFVNYIDEKSDADLYKLLSARRAILDENTALAIKEVYTCENPIGKIHAYLIKTVAEKLDNIQGYVFLDICQKPLPKVPDSEDLRPIIQYERKMVDPNTGNELLEFKLCSSSAQEIVIVPFREIKRIGIQHWKLSKNNYFYADISKSGKKLYGFNLQKANRDI